MLNILIIFFLISSPDTSAIEIIGEEKIGDINLSQTVRDYYTFEKDKDWKLTYEYRTRKFRETVDYDLYLNKMMESSKGWNLIGVEILEATRESSTISIEIKFVSVRKNVKHFYTEQTKWVAINGKWKSLKPGVRGLFHLNEAIVY